MADKMSVNNVLSVSSVIICSQIDVEEDDNDEISSLSSESESESEEDSSEENEMRILYAMLMVNKTWGEIPQIEKLTDYVERVVPEYSRITFKEHFRFVIFFH